MPHFNVLHNPKGTTLEEFRLLLSLRRETLADATKEHGMGNPLPVQWRHGWKAHIRLGGRDQDGSLMAQIVVTGPKGVIPYIRKVRLVRSERLPRSSGREWRGM